MITVQGDGRTITRNSSLFKELSKTVPNSCDSGDIQDDDFNAPSYNPTPVSPDVSVIPSSNASNPTVPCKTTNAPTLDNPVPPEGMMPASFFRVKEASQAVQFLLHCKGPQGKELQGKSLSFNLIAIEH